jgi:hypothetical protein
LAAISNPSSPRSPLKLSLFRNSFKFRVRNILSNKEIKITYKGMFLMVG